MIKNILFLLFGFWCVSAIPLTKHLSLPMKRLLKGVLQDLPLQLDDAELFESPYIKFTKRPSNTQVKEGEQLTLFCEANGIPPPVIQWYFDGKPVTQGRFERDDNTLEKLLNLGMVTIENSVTRSKLSIPCVNTKHIGVYTCAAKNGHETIETEALVDVIEGNESVVCEGPAKKRGTESGESAAPVIYMWTDGRFERDDANVQLFCRAKGNPEPKVEWLNEEGERITDDEIFTLLPNGDLLIKTASWEVSGVYTCVASNMYGKDTVEAFFYPTEPEEKEK